MSGLQITKFWLVNHLALAKDALHIYVALAVLFGSSLIFGWRVAGWRPITLVAVVAIAGEAWDIRDRIAGGIPVDLSGNWHDIWNTLLWPLAIFALARWTQIFRAR